MSVVNLEKHPSVENYQTYNRRLCVPFAITHHATPANKVRQVDLSDAVILACEGQTADAAAVDTGTNFATPDDATGVFGFLVYNIGTCTKVLNAEVKMLSSGTIALTLEGASNTGVTASGNLAISADSSVSLAATDLSGTLVVDYRVQN